MSTQEYAARRRPTEFYPAMLQLANKLNCQLRPTPEDATILRGLCPFHEATVMNKAKTLKVDTKTSRFQCHYCHASGNPIAFAAMVWGINAHDASNFLKHLEGEAGIQRPRWGPEHFTQNADRKPHARTLNSAVLTRASRYFEQNLYTSYPVLSFLARLGINPEVATQEVQMGYSTGQGLTEYLLGESDADEDEVRDSGLVDTNNGMDIFAGRITLTDTDHTGGALWIGGFNAEPPDNRKWYKERPNVIGVVGRKPFMFGQHTVTRDKPHPVITDDARFYIVLKAEGQAAILLPQRGSTDEGNLERSKRIAETLNNRRIKKAALAMHNRDLSRSLQNAILLLDPGAEIIMHPRSTVLKNLRPETRNLAELLAHSTVDTGNTRSKLQTEERTGNEGAEDPDASRDGTGPRPAGNAMPESEEEATAGTYSPEEQPGQQPSYRQADDEEQPQ